ncbi:hypothetical protein SLS54_002353 [Diplodia seriata]
MDTCLTTDPITDLRANPGRLLLRTQVAKLCCAHLDELIIIRVYHANHCGDIIGMSHVPRISTNPRMRLDNAAWTRAIKSPESHNVVALSIGQLEWSWLRDMDELRERFGSPSLGSNTSKEPAVFRSSRTESAESLGDENEDKWARFRNTEMTFASEEGWIIPPPAVNVMMIGWNGNVAYRMGIGQVPLTQWIKLEPEFKTLVLE